ncbi:MAG: ABC transporter substrate-binding protein [Opitutales bacterium]
MAFASCSKQESASAERVVSALLPLSGDFAFLGEPGRYALEIAAEKMKEEEIPLRFKLHDTKADPKEAVTILRREQDINGRNIFIVTLSGPSLAVREALSGESALMLSVAIHPDLPSTNAPIIRFCASATQEATMLAERLEGTGNPVALVVSRDPATTFQVNNHLLPALKAANKEIAFVEWFDVGNKDFKNLSAKLAGTATKEIVLLGYGSDFPGALEAISQARGTRPTTVYGGIGFAELAGKPGGMDEIDITAVVPAFYIDDSLPGVTEFKADYKAKSGKPAPYDAAFTYDAAITLGQLIQSGVNTPDEMLRNLRGRTLTGVTGTIRIGDDGEATTDLRWATLSKSGLEPTK